MNGLIHRIRSLFGMSHSNLYAKILTLEGCDLLDFWEILRGERGENDAFDHVTTSNEIMDGCYSVKGFNPGEFEKSYFGTLSIDSKLGKAVWAIGVSEQYQWGEIEIYNTMTRVHFHFNDENEVYNGVVLYRKVSNDKLIGYWVEEDVVKIGREDIEFRSSLSE